MVEVSKSVGKCPYGTVLLAAYAAEKCYVWSIEVRVSRRYRKKLLSNQGILEIGLHVIKGSEITS